MKDYGGGDQAWAGEAQGDVGLTVLASPWRAQSGDCPLEGTPHWAETPGP